MTITLRDDAEGVANSIAALITRMVGKTGGCVRAEEDLAGALMDLVDHHVERSMSPSGDAPPQTDEFVGSDAWDRLDHESKSPNDEVEVLSADVSELLSAVLWYRAKGGDAPQEPSDTPSRATMALQLGLALGYHGPTKWQTMLTDVQRLREASRPPGGAEPGLIGIEAALEVIEHHGWGLAGIKRGRARLVQEALALVPRDHRGAPAMKAGWDGWGKPTFFTLSQAREHRALVKADGKCGAVRLTTFGAGVAVCDHDEADCEDAGHCDGRLQVVWP